MDEKNNNEELPEKNHMDNEPPEDALPKVEPDEAPKTPQGKHQYTPYTYSNNFDVRLLNNHRNNEMPKKEPTVNIPMPKKRWFKPTFLSRCPNCGAPADHRLDHVDMTPDDGSVVAEEIYTFTNVPLMLCTNLKCQTVIIDRAHRQWMEAYLSERVNRGEEIDRIIPFPINRP